VARGVALTRKTARSDKFYDPPMQREAVQSRALLSVGYDVAARTLELEFSSGSVYQYFEVPEFTHRALMHAKSKGHFFQTAIDRKFRCEEVKYPRAKNK
jgi:hypothetical protein